MLVYVRLLYVVLLELVLAELLPQSFDPLEIELELNDPSMKFLSLFLHMFIFV